MLIKVSSFIPSYPYVVLKKNLIDVQTATEALLRSTWDTLHTSAYPPLYLCLWSPSLVNGLAVVFDLGCLVILDDLTDSTLTFDYYWQRPVSIFYCSLFFSFFLILGRLHQSASVTGSPCQRLRTLERKGDVKFTVQDGLEIQVWRQCDRYLGRTATLIPSKAMLPATQLPCLRLHHL